MTNDACVAKSPSEIEITPPLWLIPILFIIVYFIYQYFCEHPFFGFPVGYCA